MIADMTNQDPAIVETLAQAYNVNSIPFYIVVPPSGEAIKPPPSPLTPGNLIKALEAATK